MTFFFFLKKVACNYLSSPDTKGPGIGSLYPINTFCQHFVVYFQTGCREPRTEKKKKIGTLNPLFRDQHQQKEP